MTNIEVKSLTPQICYELLNQGKAILIDVREKNEHAAANIDGAILLPLSNFAIDKLPDDKNKIAIYHCRSGQRTANNFSMFMQTGFNEIYHMEGGIIAWGKAGLPVNTA